MMGRSNADLRAALESVFDCVCFDWRAVLQTRDMHKLVCAAFKEFQPDYVFMHIQSDAIPNETLAFMSESSKVISWTGDVRHPLPQHYINTGRLIHKTLFTNENDVMSCEGKINADFLQIGYDSKAFNPIGEKKIYPEVLFLGTNYPSIFPLSDLRRIMVEKLKLAFGSRVGIYGGGWSVSNVISGYEAAGIAYRSCKMAINLSHFAYSRYSSARLFQILGSGTLCLTHRFPNMERDFKIGDELVVWENIDDLKEKINYYLNPENESERTRIAINGYKLASSNYTWHHFANKLNSHYTN